MTKLTPEQSADVIQWQHDAANQEYRDHGWRDKVPVGRVALRCANIIRMERQAPDGRDMGEQPLLTLTEQSEGIDALQRRRQEQDDAAAGAVSDEEYAQAERLADQGVAPMGEARYRARKD